LALANRLLNGNSVHALRATGREKAPADAEKFRSAVVSGAAPTPKQQEKMAN